MLKSKSMKARSDSGMGRGPMSIDSVRGSTSWLGRASKLPFSLCETSRFPCKGGSTFGEAGVRISMRCGLVESTPRSETL